MLMYVETAVTIEQPRIRWTPEKHTLNLGPDDLGYFALARATAAYEEAIERLNSSEPLDDAERAMLEFVVETLGNLRYLRQTLPASSVATSIWRYADISDSKVNKLA